VNVVQQTTKKVVGKVTQWKYGPLQKIMMAFLGILTNDGDCCENTAVRYSGKEERIQSMYVPFGK